MHCRNAPFNTEQVGPEHVQAELVVEHPAETRDNHADEPYGHVDYDDVFGHGRDAPPCV